MKNIRFIFIRALLTAALVAGGQTITSCRSDHDHSHHDEESEVLHEGEADHDHDGKHSATERGELGERGERGEGSHGGDEIVMTPEQARRAGVETENSTATTFHGTVRTGGKVLAASGTEATVAAPGSGIVRLRGHFPEGAAIGAGTPLFTINNSGLQEGDNAGMAGIAYKKAKENYDRLSALASNKLATAADLATAKAELDQSALALKNAGGAGGKSVSSPIAGYVKECLVKDGDYVETGAPLMTVTRDRRLQLRAELPERQFGIINRIVSAKFRTSYSERTYSLEELNGRIVSRGRTAGEGGSFIPVIFEFDNAGGIIPGSFAEIYLITDGGRKSISVPTEAITEEQGVHAVYVKTDAECYERREVKLGDTDGVRTEILAGLREGEEVVTRGAIQVKLASASKAIPGHTHNH